MSSLNVKEIDLSYLNLKPKQVKYQLSVPELVEDALQNKEGNLADSGALAVDTGKFTGRSPKDRFIVADAITQDTVWWGDINIQFAPEKFDALFAKVAAHLAEKTVYVRDGYACASEAHRLGLRVITEHAFQNLFANNLFLRYGASQTPLSPEWTIVAAPTFEANPVVDGTRQGNFSIINFSKKMILIGGTAYTGEIKKGIFSVLNFILPHEKNMLSMHCSANVGEAGDVAIFFGLSGTGKTTLSADPNRGLIGDDEHGWSDDEIFNFEGGCYAKCVDLTAEKEPQIYNAIKFGALLENICYHENSRDVDFSNISKTENTRVAYPIHHISNAVEPSVGGIPKNIFFLTADANGVLPPISKLSPEQAMFHFISGYTAKVAGTEAGVTEPQLTFSACFGKAFLPLHPMAYANLLGEKLRKHQVDVWLVNTGWSGGQYGVGQRIKLAYTRAMISAALNGKLAQANFIQDPIFGLSMPTSCDGVPSEILNPKNTWSDQQAYQSKANDLAEAFHNNFKQFADYGPEASNMAVSGLIESNA